MEKIKKNNSILSAGYWKDAARNFTNTKMLAMAAMFIALRVAAKFLKIPLAAGLYITFDSYVNALGAMIYGPLVALAVGAVSDTIGCIVAPIGPYFLPFILVEMSSSFIFALFFWNKKISIPRTLFAKFSVNFVCNIILNSIFMKWSYFVFYGIEKAEAYNIINLTRIVKNLIMFPIEAIIIAFFLNAFLPVLHKLKFYKNSGENVSISKKDIIFAVLLTCVSIGLILFYIFFLKDFIKAHNFKLF